MHAWHRNCRAQHYLIIIYSTLLSKSLNNQSSSTTKQANIGEDQPAELSVFRWVFVPALWAPTVHHIWRLCCLDWMWDYKYIFFRFMGTVENLMIALSCLSLPGLHQSYILINLMWCDVVFCCKTQTTNLFLANRWREPLLILASCNNHQHSNIVV